MATDPIIHHHHHHHHFASSDDDRTSEDDVCSICLDDFDVHHNPSTVTTCKHEFHLQCILEWSQRSKECPICWQVISFKDSASQELLSIVENERSMRAVVKIRHVYEDPEVDQAAEYTDSDFEEHVFRTFEAVASSRRYGNRRNKQRLLGVGPSQIHPSVFGEDVPAGQEPYTSLEEFHNLGYAPSQDNLERSSPMPALINQTSPSMGSSSSKPRVVDSQSPTGSPGGPIAADMQAFSESVKSKFSAASARYKESFSKSSQGLKEKLLAKKTTVKELGKGVQREMSAGIAGVAKMFERLDPSLKRNSDEVNSNSLKGKHTQDIVPTMHL